MSRHRLTLTAELRVYMGPKCSVIPRGAVVLLFAKYRRTGFIQWKGRKFNVPLRTLWKLDKAQVVRDV